MKVVRPGSSSLADADQLRKVKDIIINDDAHKFIIVSAPGKGVNNKYGVTDLLAMCHKLSMHDLNLNEISEIVESVYESIVGDPILNIDTDKILSDVKKEVTNGVSYDFIVSRGGSVSVKVPVAYLDYDPVDARDLITFGGGELDTVKSHENIKNILAKHDRTVVPGFYGINEHNNVYTFFRGGSDVTGSVIASSLDCEIYENFTDVSGLLAADPRIIKNPKPMGAIMYHELRELSYMGAKILHEGAILPLRDKNILISIKDANAPDKSGALALSKCDVRNKNTVIGTSGEKDLTVMNPEKASMNMEKGFFRRLTTVLESNDILTECMPSSIDSVSVLVSDSSITPKLNKVLEELKIYLDVDKISWERDISLIAVAGRGVINGKGVSSRTFTVLAKEGVNIKMISQGSSEIDIIIGVEIKDFKKVIRSICREFYKED